MEYFGVQKCFNPSETLVNKERETGIEPATSSLGKWLSIENKQQSRLCHSLLVG